MCSYKATNQTPRKRHCVLSQNTDIENAARQIGIKNLASPQQMVNVLAHHCPNPPQCVELIRQNSRNNENEKSDIAIPSFASHELFIIMLQRIGWVFLISVEYKDARLHNANHP